MTGWLIDPVNIIEIEFATFSQINPVSSSVISRYSSRIDNMPRLSPGEGQPFEFSITAEITDTTAIDAAWRKLNYFEKNKIQTLLIMPSEGKAVEGYVENVSNPIRADRQNITSISFKFMAGGFVMGYCKVPADLTTTGDIIADTDANGDLTLRLNAQNENGYFDIVQSSWALPGLMPGTATYNTYSLYVRAKDSAQVASDLKIIINNTTHGDRASSTIALTAGYKWYVVNYTLVAGDDGDTIRLKINKETATANNVYVDMLVLVQHYLI